ncbi:TetR/AcrR family transcriptional regulator [Fodinicurvata sediminis]|uniref:TetR/AcrR family transcriptional regulator n=1 Tax=Fodinicurvata sediminis TaxID=1121832 RepID=UPI0003B61621|nr:TetR/AcrR family transcriptional regulator [Fodinicurvata sediminis]
MNTAPQRDAETTKVRLLQAVDSVILEDGFGALGVNALARRAGVDKVLIYRYFEGLPGLLAAYAEEGDFWWQVDSLLTEPLPRPGEAEALPNALARIFERHVTFLRHHPVTLEVLAWETAERNELTIALESVREERSLALMRSLAARFEVPAPELMRQVGPMFALLGAAANYLAARGRRLGHFNGLNLHSDAGWATLCDSAARMLATAELPTPTELPSPDWEETEQRARQREDRS